MTPVQHAQISFGFITLQRMVAETAKKWYTNPKTGKAVQRNFGEVIALMHSELSEALEAHRKGLKDDKLPHRDGVEVELADCVIRIMDTAHHMGYDLVGAIIEKNQYNKNRQDHTIKSRTKVGGKKY